MADLNIWCRRLQAPFLVCTLQEEADWATAKRVLGQPKFIERLMAYDADDIPDAVIEALQRVVTDPRFTADQVCTAVGPAKQVAAWQFSWH